jgi:hypothetical protein
LRRTIVVDVWKYWGLYLVLIELLKRIIIVVRKVGIVVSRCQTVFGSWSCPGALFGDACRTAFLISSPVTGGKSIGYGYLPELISLRSAGSGIGKKASCNTLAFCSTVSAGP